MNISLTPEMDTWVAEKVKSGMYRSSSELIREGLRLLQLRDEQRSSMIGELRNDLLVGVKQLDIGKSEKLDQKFINKVKDDARKMFTV